MKLAGRLSHPHPLPGGKVIVQFSVVIAITFTMAHAGCEKGVRWRYIFWSKVRVKRSYSIPYFNSSEHHLINKFIHITVHRYRISTTDFPKGLN